MTAARDHLARTRRHRCPRRTGRWAVATCSSLVLAGVVTLAATGEPLPQVLHDRLSALAASEVVIEAVRAENAHGKTPDQIALLDEGWREMRRQPGFLAPWTGSECGQLLGKTLTDEPALHSIVVLDRSGATVALTGAIPAYCHSETACFTTAITGKRHVAETSDGLDEVCVPVLGRGNRPIGVLWATIDRQLLTANEPARHAPEQLEEQTPVAARERTTGHEHR